MKTNREIILHRMEIKLIDFATIIAILTIINTVKLIGGDILIEYGKGTDTNYAIDIGYSSDKVILKLGCGYGETDDKETVLYNAYLGKIFKLTDKTRVAINGIVGYCDRYNLNNQTIWGTELSTPKRESHFNYGAELITIVNINPKFGIIGGFEYTEYGGFLFKVGMAL